jgi:hypothetical protein
MSLPGGQNVFPYSTVGEKPSWPRSSVLEHAFPFLGIETENGGEFFNEEVAASCVREQITFTRGRPYEKRDQCFVEQKNGVVVRQVVGHGRLIGEHASRQLAELYRPFALAGFEIQHITSREDLLMITARSVSPLGTCPSCGETSAHIHS